MVDNFYQTGSQVKKNESYEEYKRKGRRCEEDTHTNKQLKHTLAAGHLRAGNMNKGKKKRPASGNTLPVGVDIVEGRSWGSDWQAGGRHQHWRSHLEAGGEMLACHIATATLEGSL